MERSDAWLKVRNNAHALESVLSVIRQTGFVVSNLRLNRSLDEASYHINMEVEGPEGIAGLSEQIAAINGVEKAEFSPAAANPAIPRLADIG